MECQAVKIAVLRVRDKVFHGFRRRLREKAQGDVAHARMHNCHLLALFRLFELVARLVLLVVINISFNANIIKIDELNVCGGGIV